MAFTGMRSEIRNMNINDDKLIHFSKFLIIINIQLMDAVH